MTEPINRLRPDPLVKMQADVNKAAKIPPLREQAWARAAANAEDIRRIAQGGAITPADHQLMKMVCLLVSAELYTGERLKGKPDAAG